MRIWEVMFAAGWIGIGAVNVVAMVSEGAWGAAPFGVAFVGAGSWFVVRSTRLAVIADDDELIVRNHYRTRRFPRSRVDAFRIGSPGMAMPFGRTINLLAGATNSAAATPSSSSTPAVLSPAGHSASDPVAAEPSTYRVAVRGAGKRSARPGRRPRGRGHAVLGCASMAADSVVEREWRV
jgi:hypothetical protein